MVDANEKAKLMQQFAGEPLHDLKVVLKCLASLLILVIMVVGPWAFLSAGTFTGAQEARPATKLGAAPSESKRVFDERRRAHETDRDGNFAAVNEATRSSPAVE